MEFCSPKMDSMVLSGIFDLARILSPHLHEGRICGRHAAERGEQKGAHKEGNRPEERERLP